MQYDIPDAFRRRLIEAILFRTEHEIEDIITADTAPGVQVRIVEEVLPNVRYELSRLTLEDLTDEGIIERHVENAVQTAKYLIERSTGKTVPAKGPTLSTERECPDCNGTGSFDLWTDDACETCDGRGWLEP